MKQLIARGGGSYSYPVPDRRRMGIRGTIEPGSYTAMVDKDVTLYLGEDAIRHTIRHAAHSLRQLEFIDATKGSTLGYETREQERLRDAAMLREVANMIEAGDLG